MTRSEYFRKLKEGKLTNRQRKQFVNVLYDMSEIEGLKYPYFRMVFSFDDIGIYIKIKPTGQTMGKIFERAKKYYMDKGEDEKSSLKKANEMITSFYTICKLLSDEKQFPFLATIYHKHDSNPGLPE